MSDWGAIGYLIGAGVQFGFFLTFRTNVKWMCLATGFLFVGMAGAKLYFAHS